MRGIARQVWQLKGTSGLQNGRQVLNCFRSISHTCSTYTQRHFSTDDTSKELDLQTGHSQPARQDLAAPQQEANVNPSEAEERQRSSHHASTSAPGLGRPATQATEGREPASGAGSDAATQEERERRRRARIRSIANLRPAAARTVGLNPDGTVSRPMPPESSARQTGEPLNTARQASSPLGGRQRTTLDAKKAYRQERAQQRREEQQRTAVEQAAASETLAAKQEARKEQRVEQRVAADAPRQRLLAGKSLREELRLADVNKYVEVDRSLLPEVFSDSPPPQELMHPKGGCSGLQAELEATRSDMILYRESVHSLLEAVQSKSRGHFYLTGPSFSGKSIALAAVVSAMRAKGWLVMYVPQALQLTHGGFFHSTGDGRWDTAECAKLLLHYLLAAHPARAAEVVSPSSGQSLRQLIEGALKNPEAAQVVDAFLEVKDTLAAAPNSMIAIDNYQALYTPSDYGEWMSQHHRRVIQPEELRVAAAMRVLEQPALTDGVAICAASRGGSYSSKVRMPMPKEAQFNILRMNRGEWDIITDYYRLQATTDDVSREVVEKMFFLTLGNPKEYRKVADFYGSEAAVA